jgi:undecaprenyl phosphate N,N'-diacetylbacillosamine 1-phosphate transferase
LYAHFIKPFFDRLFAFLILLVASPILIVIILLLTLFNKGSVWFIQPRPGYREKIFHVIKFKTMTDARDAQGNLLPDHQRLTGIGKFVRKTSLDEMPQLMNVLKGDMSFVGPRPLLVDYLPLYNDHQKRRHEVKPGITGWAQVNGRNTVEWPRRFDYDVWYVDHQSFVLDLKILFLTVIKVFKAEGISSGTTATMEKFSGN